MHSILIRIYRSDPRQGIRCLSLKSGLCTVCLIAQLSCPTLFDPMDCSSPGSSVHGILQARILEWAAIPFSRWIFLTHGLNPGLLHCRQFLYHLSHQGSLVCYLLTYTDCPCASNMYLPGKVVVVVVQSISCVWLFWPHGLQRARLPCPSPSTGVCSNSCPLSWWCHPIIPSFVILFCLQSFPASGSFAMSQLFASGGLSIGASALQMNIQDLFPLGLTSGQNIVHWRREWQTTSVFLPWEPHEQYERIRLL